MRSERAGKNPNLRRRRRHGLHRVDYLAIVIVLGVAAAALIAYLLR